MHRLFEVDRIEYFDAVAKSPEHLAAFNHNAALGVCDNKGTGIRFGIALHEIRFQPEARLAAAGAADHQHVFIARCFRVFRAVVHRQFLRLRQNDIVSGVRVNVGRNVLMRSPAGRTVLGIFAKFLRIFALDVDSQPNCSRDQNSNAEIERMETGHSRGKRSVHPIHHVQHLAGKIRAGRNAYGLTKLCRKQCDPDVGKIRENPLF